MNISLSLIVIVVIMTMIIIVTTSLISILRMLNIRVKEQGSFLPAVCHHVLLILLCLFHLTALTIIAADTKGVLAFGMYSL